MIDEVNQIVKKDVEPEGILIEKIYLIGEFRLPKSVVEALNSKIEATQRAQQRQNEVAEAEAQARKTIIDAQAEATANRLKAQTITPTFLQLRMIEAWEKGGSQVPAVLTGGMGSFPPLGFMDKLSGLSPRKKGE